MVERILKENPGHPYYAEMMSTGHERRGGYQGEGVDRFHQVGFGGLSDEFGDSEFGQVVTPAPSGLVSYLPAPFQSLVTWLGLGGSSTMVQIGVIGGLGVALYYILRGKRLEGHGTKKKR